MGDSNYLSAYKLINSQLVLNNTKLKEEIKDKIDMIIELNDQVFKYREENKTLRDMVKKLLEQFKTITTIMVSVRDQSESVFNVVYNEHSTKEMEQQMRRPLAGLVYERRRTECPPYVDEAAIAEGEDENHSMQDYLAAISTDDEGVEEEEEDEHEDDEEDEHDRSNTLAKSPLMKRLERKSRNRSFDESFETIDTNRVVKAARKSQEYLQGRDSRESKHDYSLREITGGDDEEMDISQTVVAPDIVVDAPPADVSMRTEGEQSLTIRNKFEASSISEKSGVLSDHSIQSDVNPATDQSLRPTEMKRMASDSMLVTLVEREANKENTLINDTISNATCSTPLARNRRGNRLKASIHQLSPLSPVLLVALKPLTKENLSQHNISFDALQAKVENNSLKQEELDQSDQGSMESSDSRRPRRKAAPKNFKEPSVRTKMRRQ